VPAKVIASFASMLNEDAQVFTPYGATESLPVACTGSREILGETAAMTDAGKGVCIGRPVEGIEARVIRITDDVIERWSDQLIVPPGEVGEIAVRGPQVTRAYFNRDAATRLAKIVCDDGSFWHRMGDLGYLDTSGRLWFCGRKSHRVRVAVEDGRLGGDPGHRNAPAWGGELYTIPCEAVFNTHAKVFRTALVGVPNGAASRAVLCVQTESGVPASEHDVILRDLLELAASHEHTRPIGEVLFHPAFPVDVRHNAKIGREKLALWAAKKLRGRT
jgi:acyl-CoA synthetase (AMP-forming)/AMP-acid ligase II